MRVSDLESAQQDSTQEKFGPAVAACYDKEGNPTPAAKGFARSCGVELSELETVMKDGQEKLVYRSSSKGRNAEELLPQIVSNSLARLPIPRKMRWGSSRDEFVRPVHWVLMIFGTDVIETTILGIKSGNSTRGHRFHHPGPITIGSTQDYAEKLRACHVIVDHEEREKIVREGA